MAHVFSPLPARYRRSRTPDEPGLLLTQCRLSFATSCVWRVVTARQRQSSFCHGEHSPIVTTCNPSTVGVPSSPAHWTMVEFWYSDGDGDSAISLGVVVSPCGAKSKTPPIPFCPPSLARYAEHFAPSSGCSQTPSILQHATQRVQCIIAQCAQAGHLHHTWRTKDNSLSPRFSTDSMHDFRFPSPSLRLVAFPSHAEQDHMSYVPSPISL
ncbi:hypothetical protein B0T24DRAFT_83236 [Lasiosphaeria ovina]|uniref:Uncharacterized protein n=1 Tax=Lasiosphaeria ovina TaxID=92902 RepID=A0AAE0NMZ0_9PEZI|nr:hypothetical protein B0T24DRAFT_83236 [Lasiosphaeria ovina]